MQCNGSGWSNPQRGGAFGIVSYDWSNAKAQWSKQQPMDCEERLLTQARATKSTSPQSRVFVYRNVVKALPWFSSVRKLLDDPAYSGFFLKFGHGNLHVPNCAPENQSKCSVYYHDQEQTPEVPTAADPHPDGSCPSASAGGCDCGNQPCGEYLWDHRNGSMLREWILEHHIGGPTCMGSPAIDGLFIDDYWCSNLLCQEDPSIRGCPCGDPVQGPTEIDRNSQADMGLSDEDVRDITLAWNETMGAVQQSILDAGGYTWSLMAGQQNANAMPRLLKRSTCALQLRAACAGGASEQDWQSNAHLVGLTVSNGTQLTQLEEDVAFFLLVRGPFAWLGFGQWGMTWPFNAEPAHGELPPLPHGVPRPPLIDRDFGEPIDELCKETRDGVFQRLWSRGGIVELDCNTFKASFGA